jgi:hypothetical protein
LAHAKNGSSPKRAATALRSAVSSGHKEASAERA